MTYLDQLIWNRDAKWHYPATYARCDGDVMARSHEAYLRRWESTSRGATSQYFAVFVRLLTKPGNGCEMHRPSQPFVVFSSKGRVNEIPSIAVRTEAADRRVTSLERRLMSYEKPLGHHLTEITTAQFL
ncbi:hypothetical protein KCU67_g21, partial [Aureobasidium melanogenum]